MIQQSTIRALLHALAAAEAASETQDELAKRLGISPALISDVKKARHANVSRQRENELRRALGLRLLTEQGNVKRQRNVSRLHLGKDDEHALADLGITARQAFNRGIAEYRLAKLTGQNWAPAVR